MAGEEKDFTQLSDDEVMNLGAADFERMAAEEEARNKQAEETDEDREAREAAEAEANEAEQNDKGDEDDEQANAAEPVVEETEEDRLAREAEEEADLDEEELAELRSKREAAKKAVTTEQPNKKPAGKTKTDPKGDGEQTFDAEGAKKLFEPFTANGRKMSIRSPEEGVRLMQLGAGYNAKMEALKPDLAVIATLRREGLLDGDKLSFLIDLHKKNPEAIGKLVKDSGVDVLDLDETKVAGYKPGNYSTSTKEVEMDQVLDGLKDSPTYSQLMDNVANKWDRQSKQEVGNNPAILQRIDQHMQAGWYDKIVDEVQRKKALGEIPSGTPFLEAYAKTGDELNAAGAFGQTETPPPRKLVRPGKEEKAPGVDEQRRRAAAPTKAAGNPEAKKKVVDVWNMSDADFEKLKI